jgi:hypothetical protein
MTTIIMPIVSLAVGLLMISLSFIWWIQDVTKGLKAQRTKVIARRREIR